MTRKRRPEGEPIWVPHGMIGFPGLTRFRLIAHGEENPFAVLQSEEREEVRFPLIDPFVVRPDYDVDLAPGQLEELEIEDRDDARVFVVVTAPEDPRQMTVNLRAPLVVGRDAGVGLQFVAGDEGLSVRARVLDEFRGERGGLRAP